MENIVLSKFIKDHQDFFNAVIDRVITEMHGLEYKKRTEDILKKYNVETFDHVPSENLVRIKLSGNSLVGRLKYTNNDDGVNYSEIGFNGDNFILNKGTIFIEDIFNTENSRFPLSVQMELSEKNIIIKKNSNIIFELKSINLTEGELTTSFENMYKDILEYLNGEEDSILKVEKQIDFFNLIAENNNLDILIKQDGFFGINKVISDTFNGTKKKINKMYNSVL